MRERFAEYTVSAGSDERLAVRLELKDTGRGWLGLLTGGESPHIGGVVLATPRPSLADPSKTSCDVASIPVSGHLDNEVGSEVAALLCKTMEDAVVVVSGIHADNASPDDITEIYRNVSNATGQMLDQIDRSKNGHSRSVQQDSSQHPQVLPA